jgi:hypothetical protein
MKRATILLIALVFLSAASPLVFTQDQPSSALPPDILGPQLIAWSQLQKPRPMPQPLPPPDQPAQQADQQPEQRPSQPPDPDTQQQQPTPQIFTGTIVKDGPKYVLKVADNSTYQLDDQERVKQYEGKRVKVSGTLDANVKILRIISIELIS